MKHLELKHSKRRAAPDLTKVPPRVSSEPYAMTGYAGIDRTTLFAGSGGFRRTIFPVHDEIYGEPFKARPLLVSPKQYEMFAKAYGRTEHQITPPSAHNMIVKPRLTLPQLDRGISVIPAASYPNGYHPASSGAEDDRVKALMESVRQGLKLDLIKDKP